MLGIAVMVLKLGKDFLSLFAMASRKLHVSDSSNYIHIYYNHRTKIKMI